MALQEVLIMALSRMRGGLCSAGFSKERDPVTGLKWVRPVKTFDTLLPADLEGPDGRLPRCGDVVELDLREPHPRPPHVEDWVTEFVHHRPRVVRRLDGEAWARFLDRYVDPAPEEVLCQEKRSLCLVRPGEVWGSFRLDGYSGKFEARLGFTLPGDANHPRACSQRGASVTCLFWEELGRRWLSDRGGYLAFDHQALLERLGAEALYLTVGLSRTYQGEHWPLVVGVHPVFGGGEGDG